MKREHFISTAIDAVFMVVTFGGIILILSVWGKTTYERQSPAVEYITVEVPAVTVQVVTATPEPTEVLHSETLPLHSETLPYTSEQFTTATPQPTATVPLVDLAEVKIVSIKPDNPSMLYPIVFELEVHNLGDIFWNGAYSIVAMGLAIDPDDGILSCPPKTDFLEVVEPGESITIKVTCYPIRPQQEMDLQWLVLNDRNQFLQTGALPVGAGEDAIPVVPPNMTLRIMSVKPTPPSGRKLKTIVEGVLGKGWEACPPGG